MKKYKIIKGTNKSETIFGTSDNNIIKAGGGNDIIYTGDGNNKIYTQSRLNDNVVVYDGQNSDVFYTGKGNESYIFENQHGNDIIYLYSKSNITLDLSDFENINFSSFGNDLIIKNTSSCWRHLQPRWRMRGNPRLYQRQKRCFQKMHKCIV